MKKVKSIIKIGIRYALIVINDCLNKLPIKQDVALFESFNGKGITDNPKAIYDEWVKLRPEIQKSLYFGIKSQYIEDVKQSYPHINIVKRWSFKWIYISARAQYWVFNSRMPTWWHKNKQTTYVQTWHGTPLKHLALDMDQVNMPGADREKYLNEFVKESARWDYLIAPNQYSLDIFKRAFRFENEFLKTGYPRNDYLIKNNHGDAINQLKKKIINDEHARVVTYAPTWREDDFIKVGEYHFRWHFNLGKLIKMLPGDVKVIIRPHYLVTDNIDIAGYEDRVIVDRNTDMNELYLISDVLITDYSSVMFDYAILDRPLIFFAYDLEKYRDELRGFYFDYYSELPGPIVSDETDLFNSVKNALDNADDFKIDDAFKAKFTNWEKGTAAQQVIKKITNGEI